MKIVTNVVTLAMSWLVLMSDLSVALISPYFRLTGIKIGYAVDLKRDG